MHLCSLKDKTRKHEEFQSFHAKKTKNVFCIVFPTLQNKYRITFVVAVFEKPQELTCTANVTLLGVTIFKFRNQKYSKLGANRKYIHKNAPYT